MPCSTAMKANGNPRARGLQKVGAQWLPGAQPHRFRYRTLARQGEANRAAFGRLFSDSPGGATARAILAEALRIQRIDPQIHDMEIGYAYDCGALIPDGTTPPARDPMAGIYHPTSRPGSRVPHAMIVAGGVRCSTHDRMPRADFLLISESPIWPAAAATAGEAFGIRIETLDPGRASGSHDVTCDWRHLCQVDPSGVVLVRSDGHVGWRSIDAPSDAAAELAAAMCAILDGGIRDNTV